MATDGLDVTEVFGLYGLADECRNWLYGFDSTRSMVHAARLLVDVAHELLGEAELLDCFGGGE